LATGNDCDELIIAKVLSKTTANWQERNRFFFIKKIAITFPSYQGETRLIGRAGKQVFIQAIVTNKYENQFINSNDM
jgi:hypothetical protein